MFSQDFVPSNVPETNVGILRYVASDNSLPQTTQAECNRTACVVVGCPMLEAAPYNGSERKNITCISPGMFIGDDSRDEPVPPGPGKPFLDYPLTTRGREMVILLGFPQISAAPLPRVTSHPTLTHTHPGWGWVGCE